ncbi:MAG: hypothetical protein ACD_7C00030G0009 [uncultured bacterium]|nr:MAG: hypothetical protein ACD_7C00030G0009 [uncultured bacterium]HBR79019.1 hypothetical protein [Candidatus Moranbacteria bacterium]
MKIIEIAQAQVIANAPTFTEIGGSIVNFMLRVLGFFVIIGLAITAIIYFTAAGNEDRIKLAKKSFFYSIVGIVVGLGTMIILSQIGILLQ